MIHPDDPEAIKQLKREGRMPSLAELVTALANAQRAVDAEDEAAGMAERSYPERDQPPYRWGEIAECLAGRLALPVEEIGTKPREAAGVCPRCKDPMEWVAFTNSPELWKNLCGTAGWVEVCTYCRMWGRYVESSMS